MHKKVMHSCFAVLFLAYAMFLPTDSFCEVVNKQPIPDTSWIVGSPACPKLNAHNKQACQFSFKGHDWQVWPGRISVKQGNQPDLWFIEGTGHKDGMFDHTLAIGKDDHITFQCAVRTNTHEYYGPIGISIKKGGYWATYGTAASTVAGGVAGIATVFIQPEAAPIAAVAGEEGAKALGAKLSQEFGNKKWAKHAPEIAEEICKALANPK